MTKSFILTCALLLAPTTAMASLCSGAVKEEQMVMEKMHHAMMITYTGDTDIDFAAGMAPHHQGAIDMANIELKYGMDPDMRRLAEWIIKGQTEEIGQMHSWLYGRVNPQAPVKDTEEVAQYKAAMEKMHHVMMIDYTGNADIDFARGMIPHHQGAIDMATIEFRDGKNAEMNKLADNIINAQQNEIGIMQRWLAKQTIPASMPENHPMHSHSMKEHHHHHDHP